MSLPIKRLTRSSSALLCLAGLLAALPAAAASLPLWEVGAGVAGMSLPDYRGSDQTTSYIFPVPYFVYRGEFLKADRNGVRGMLFDSDKVELNLSLNGTLPVNSRDNLARRGMPNLKPTVELGANLSVNLWQSSNQDIRLDFRAPVRTAVTIESSPQQIGWLFSPNLNIDIKNPAGLHNWNLGMLAGPLFNSRRYHAYFYSVDPAQAIAGRPAYSAPGGYAGSQATLALSRRAARSWVGAFLRYDTVAGAAFENSPLVRQRHAVSAGIAATWVFGESSTRVNADE